MSAERNCQEEAGAEGTLIVAKAHKCQTASQLKVGQKFHSKAACYIIAAVLLLLDGIEGDETQTAFRIWFATDIRQTVADGSEHGEERFLDIEGTQHRDASSDENLRSQLDTVGGGQFANPLAVSIEIIGFVFTVELAGTPTEIHEATVVGSEEVGIAIAVYLGKRGRRHEERNRQ